MDLGLQDKVAIITGAASAKGIGNAIARALAAEGVHLVLTDILGEGIETFAGELRDKGHKAIAVQGDQSVHEEVQAVVELAGREFGRVDILVNSAALTNNLGSITSMSPEKWRRELDVSLTGPFLWIREVVPLMRQNGWGRIINISSTNSIFGKPGVPGYVTAKGGLNVLTKQVARDYAARGITCNCLVLGPIATEIYERECFDEEVVKKMIEAVPMKRMGTPDEVGSVAAFLCSEQASFVTGDLITIDGAMSLNI